jgi:hypothetical protein
MYFFSVFRSRKNFYRSGSLNLYPDFTNPILDSNPDPLLAIFNKNNFLNIKLGTVLIKKILRKMLLVTKGRKIHMYR